MYVQVNGAGAAPSALPPPESTLYALLLLISIR